MVVAPGTMSTSWEEPPHGPVCSGAARALDAVRASSGRSLNTRILPGLNLHRPTGARISR